MGWFERYTLCCVVLVIVTLSCILVASVELMHRLEDGINRNNGALLQKLGSLRLAESMAQSELLHEREASNGPLLVVIIRSMKRNYALRRVIRRTWAQSDRRVVYRFALHSSKAVAPVAHGAVGETKLDIWLNRLHRRASDKIDPRYFLFVDERVFVNTRFLLDAIERILPSKEFILCIPSGDPRQHLPCDPASPILVTADVRGSASKKYPVHDGGRLYLSQRETEALLQHQIDSAPWLAYFFTASLDQLTITAPMTQLIERIWLATVDNYTSVEY